MLVFFTMGFVDLVGIASNYVKLDLGLTDSEANIFPSLVFFWFLIFSVPTGMLMNKIGRKKTVMLSLVVTFVSLLIPCFGDGYMVMLVSFSLLGIGNALMQTSLNPLLSNIITEDKLASSLTFGQFVKAIASFLAPYIAMWGATAAIPSLGLGWRVLFPIYMDHVPCRHRCWYEYYRPKDPDGKVGGGYTCGGICNEPLFHFSYDRLPDRFVGLSSLGGEEVFCRQCRTDGCFDGRFPFV